MLEWVVSVANFPEEVDLILVSKEGGSNTVDRCVAPSLIVEATGFVEEVEVFHICIPSPEVEVADFKVAPEVAEVVGLATVIRKERHCVIFRDVFRVLFNKLLSSLPERRDGSLIFIQRNCEAINFLLVLHN